MCILTGGSVMASDGVLRNVQSSVKLRPRIEIVDSKKSATALTNRLQAGIRADISGVKNLSVNLEATKITAINNDYNSGSKEGGHYNSDKATVIDPPVMNLTKAFLSYKMKNTTFELGEKPLNLDTQRFIGSVGWRQMPQTFGVFSVHHKSSEKLSVLGAWLYRRNGIKPELDKGYKHGSGLFHTTYTVSPLVNLVGYTYFLEDIHNTYGINMKGNVNVNSLNVFYRAEYAKQGGPGSGVRTIDTDYVSLEAGAKALGFVSKLGYEVFGDKGRGDAGFSTPYATGHKFNGWSDVLLGKTLSGNDDGLRDVYLAIGYESNLFGKSMVAYHKFNSKENSVALGSEIDILYKKKVSSNVSFLLKMALYNNDGNTSFDNTKKYWFMTTIDL